MTTHEVSVSPSARPWSVEPLNRGADPADFTILFLVETVHGTSLHTWTKGWSVHYELSMGVHTLVCSRLDFGWQLRSLFEM